MRISLSLLAVAMLQAFADPVSAPGTSVALIPPDDLPASARFSGWASRNGEAWIQVVELPAPVEKTTEGFRNAERLAAQRMTLLGAEKVQLAGGPAELFAFTQRAAGVDYRKWSLVMGANDRTAVITASCLAEIEQKWREPFRRSLLSARWSSPAPARDPFRIQPAGGFQRSAAMAGSVVFTVGGESLKANPGSPLFLVSRSSGAAPVTDLEQFAETRARQLPDFREIRIDGKRAVSIDGLNGVELTGTTGSKSLFQVVLAEPGGGYYLIVGISPVGKWEQYLPIFRQMGESFRR